MTASHWQECPTLRRAFDLVRTCHRIVLTSTSDTELLQAVCECMVREGGYTAAWIHRAGGEQPRAVAGEARVDPDHPGSLALPLGGTEDQHCTLHLIAPATAAPDEREVALLEEVAEDIRFGLDHLQLTERQRRLEALVEAAPDMVGFAEPGNSERPPRPTYLNPAGQALLGRPSDNDPPRILDYHPRWAARQLWEEALPRARERGSWRGESAVLGPGGAEIPVDLTLIAHRGSCGEVKQLSTIARDIRDRKRVEEGLRREAAQAETMAQGLVESLPGLFYLFDGSGKLHRWNQELERITGLAGGELTGRLPADFFPAEHRQCIAAAFQRALETGAAEAEADLLTADGPVPHHLQAHRITLDGWPFVIGIGMDVSAQREAEAHNRLTATVFEAAHDALMITDPDGCILEVNPAFTEQTGYAREEALGATPGGLLDSHEHRPGFFEAVFAEVDEHGSWEGTIHNRRRDGTTVIHRETIAKVCDEQRRVTHYVATMADVTPIKEAEHRARREREITDAVVDSLPGVFFFLDRQGYNHRCNRRAAEYAGTNPAQCTQRAMPALSFFDPVDRPTVQQQIQAGFETGQGAELETELISRDGRRTPILFNASPIEIGGETYLAGLGIDIRRRRDLEEDLRHLARTDPLTGACNRAGFDMGLAERLAEAERYGHPFAVALVDLDYFKELNDGHGHQGGDRMLEALVEEIATRTREVDSICRWGGEEFMVLLPHTDLAGARRWGERLRAHLAERPLVDGLPITTVSIGLTEYQPGDDADSLVGRADAAMYAAKEAGRNRVDCR